MPAFEPGVNLGRALRLLGQSDGPPVPALTEPMIRVECAWCGKHMGDKPAEGVEPGVSHSICPDCLAALRTQRDAMRRRAGPLDYALDKLDSSVWDDAPVGEPTLRPQVSEAILKALDELQSRYQIDDHHVADVFVAGSITGLQYSDDSDVDVQLVLDVDDATLDRIHHEIEGLNAKYRVSTHPVHFYVLTPHELGDLQRRYDAIYDVLEQRWVKGPAGSVSDDPEALEQQVFDKAQEFAERVDLEMGRTHRDARDLAYLQQAVGRAPSHVQSRVESRLTHTVQRLEQDIATLSADLDEIHQARAHAFQQALESGGTVSPNLVPENLLWKILERWRYVQALQAVKSLTKGGLTNDEVLQLAN